MATNHRGTATYLSVVTEPIRTMAEVLRLMLHGRCLIVDDYGYAAEAGVMVAADGDLSWQPVDLDIAETLIERAYVRTTSRVGTEERFELTTEGRRAIDRWSVVARREAPKEIAP